MIILGIDTSCDDTSVALLRDDCILANIVSSQDDIHREWGGVVPNLARHAHETNFERVYQTALRRAHVALQDIDALAVTLGPGLAISLEVGLKKAKQLAEELSIPLYAINHMEGHLLSSLARTSTGRGTKLSDLSLPFLGLLVSGGHTEVILANALGSYEVLGQTVDDALGEAFDKVARMLGLGYPGGAALAKLAQQGNPSAYTLPIPMRGSGDMNVSYSGLKTATRNLIYEITDTHPDELTKQQIVDIAATFQQAALKTILLKMEKALIAHPVKDVVLGGGVAANLELRKQLRSLAQRYGAKLHVPRQKKLASDNGAMIALAAYWRIQHGFPPSSLNELDRQPQLNIAGA